jgi:Cu/Ag efflux protein CusF
MSHTSRRFLVSAMLAGVPIILISPAAVRAQGMSQMPGMGDAKQETTASVIGTITAINAADRRVTLNHSAIPEIKMARNENGISSRAVSGSFQGESRR